VKAPAGFVAVRAGALVRRGHEAELEDFLAAAASSDAREVAPPVGGRGTTRCLTLRDGGEAFVRRYVHGGLLGALLGDRYWQRPSRPLRELIATEAARTAGIVAPEVLAAIVQPAAAGGLLYRGVLVTRALAGRRALAEVLRAATDDAGRRAWIACAVRTVRRLHGAGIHHPDLNVSNVLVGDDPQDDAALIDFDRAWVGTGPVGSTVIARARRRLSRSIAKLGLPGLDRAGAAAALDAAGLGVAA
jgi:hypothetical protein